MNLYNLFVNNFPLMIISVVGTAILLLSFRAVALKTGLVDVPNPRKIHVKPIPLVGGLALFVMLIILWSVSNNSDVFSFYLIMASGLIVLVGLLDDLYQLGAMWRFLVQIIASLLMVYFAHVSLITFGNLLAPGWELDLGLLAIPITVFGVVGIINALNMADGIDGLAAMTFCLPVMVLVGITGHNSLSLWLLMIIVCVFVFVVFNKSKKYKVFLGDCGSLLLGFILSWLLVYFSQGETAAIRPVSALYMVALPLYDTIYVMLRRILKGKSPFKPDNTHLHHLFLAQGWSQTRVLITMILSQAILIFLGVLFLYIGLAEYLQFYLFVLLSALYYNVMKQAWAKTIYLKD